MRVELPNQDLLHHLFHTYYQNAVESHDEDFISSHWKHYSSLANVRVGKDGSFSELSGVGFGVYSWLGRKHKFLEKLSVVSHLGHLSHRNAFLADS